MSDQPERLFPSATDQTRRVEELRARLAFRYPQRKEDLSLIRRCLRFQPLCDLFRRARKERGWGCARTARVVGVGPAEVECFELAVGLLETELPWLVDLAWWLGVGEPLAQWVEANPALAFETGLPDANTLRARHAERTESTRAAGLPLPPPFAVPADWHALATGPLENVPDIFGHGGGERVWKVLAWVTGITPAIWRKFELRTDLTFAQFHEVMQVAFGWNSTHLHAWDIGRRRYGRPDLMEEPVNDERQVRLDDFMRLSVGDELDYWYDFGDGWRVCVRIESFRVVEGAPPVRCLGGSRAGPPDDCGGPTGYRELMAILNGPPSPRRRELRQWVGADYDPDAFDADDVNAALARRNRRWDRSRPRS